MTRGSLAFPKVTPLGALSVLLVLALAFAVWQIVSINHQRDALSQDLLAERQAHSEARRSVRELEMRYANYALETKVRRDVVNERMEEQQQLSAELEERAKAIAQEKLAEANCITPKSVMNLVGL